MPRYASMKRTTRRSSSSSILSMRVHAVSAMQRSSVGVGGQDHVVRIAIHDRAEPGLDLLRALGLVVHHHAAVLEVVHLELLAIGRAWTPQGAMYGRCGPEVGGSEL